MINTIMTFVDQSDCS